MCNMHLMAAILIPSDENQIFSETSINVNKLTFCNPDFYTDASVSGWIGEKREVGSFVGN